MTDEIKHTNTTGHGDFERRDIGAAGVIYFLLGLVAAVLIVHFMLAGLYDFLDKRQQARQPAVNPLIENVPTDTRKIPPKYPEKAFPEPRLETDERTQLNDIRLGEEQTLNSYGWVGEKAGTVRIPIERAMDLLAQRGLPLCPAGCTDANAAGTKAKEQKTNAPKAKGTKQ